MVLGHVGGPYMQSHVSLYRKGTEEEKKDLQRKKRDENSTEMQPQGKGHQS